MRELGVLYNSNYYAISEHPGYGGRRGSGLDDDDDLADEDDIEVDDGGEVGDSIGTLLILILTLKQCLAQSFLGNRNIYLLTMMIIFFR